MYFIGDVHGKFDDYYQLIEHHKMDCSCQLGDMGLGFGPVLRRRQLSIENRVVWPNHKFIRGNHDNPEACAKYGNFLDGFGYNPLNRMFHITGGATVSFDRWHRTEGIDIWEDEELSYKQLKDAIELFGHSKPEVVVSHDCPSNILPLVLPRGSLPETNRTAQAMQAMFDIHRPLLWIFGHHHTNSWNGIGKTMFRGLGELDWINVKGLSWDAPVDTSQQLIEVYS